MFGKSKRSSDRFGDDRYQARGRDDAEYGYAEYGDAQYRDAQYGDAQYSDAQYESANYGGVGYDDAEYDDGYDEPAAGPTHATADYDDDYDEPAVAQSGPYDFNDVSELIESVAEQRLDLGSVILPVPPGGQLQVEMTPEGQPQAVHLSTAQGRITVAAYAAPKSPGQWRTVAADLADSLRKDGARVAVETGPWGRELLAITDTADLRFIGVDGYRWMVRLVAAGPSGAVNDDSPLIAAARATLRETVVRRGEDPLPVRDPLPVVLPQELADQLAAAHQQQVDAQAQAQEQAMAAQAAAARPAPRNVPQATQAVIPPRMPEGPRRGADGSAMQQLGLN